MGWLGLVGSLVRVVGPASKERVEGAKVKDREKIKHPYLRYEYLIGL